MEWFALLLLLLSTVMLRGDGDPNDYFFEILEPKDLSYSFQIRMARFSAKPAGHSFRLQLVLATPPKLCNLSSEYPSPSPSGVWLIERGDCSFVHKVKNAERLGAAIVLISDIEAGDGNFIDMMGTDSADKTKIPAFYLPGTDGRHLRTHLLYGKDAVWIKIPLNLSFVPLHMVRKPPWDPW
uniref:PA domain-containing protein n=1 Tax=Trichuris muris TaxID=70415 RepID=A0A5S6QQN9_TRIMR